MILFFSIFGSTSYCHICEIPELCVNLKSLCLRVFVFRINFESVKLTPMLLPQQTRNHLLHQVIDIQQFQFHARVIHRIGQVIRHSIAERRHSRVMAHKCLTFYLCTVGIQRQYTLTAVNKRTTCFSRFALLYELVLLPHNVCFCSDCLINCKGT